MGELEHSFVYPTNKVYKSAIWHKYIVYIFGFLSVIRKLKLLVSELNIETNEVYIILKDTKFLSFFFLFCKNHLLLQLKVITDITAVDFIGRLKRFRLYYHTLSIRFNFRLSVALDIDELASVDSIISIYKGANWYEREVWDLFGIYFDGHNDLRRILTDYSFEGHALRKDFPLTGFFEVFYNDLKKRITYQAVSLPQEYRYFTFLNPWINNNVSIN